MVSRLTGILDTYDILGKAIPGVAWFFGFILLLPSELFSFVFQDSPTSNTQPSLKLGSIVTLIIIAILIGLLFGQAVDTLARLFEQVFAWIRAQMLFIYQLFSLLSSGVVIWLGRTDRFSVDSVFDSNNRLSRSNLLFVVVSLCLVSPTFSLFILYSNSNIIIPIIVSTIVILLLYLSYNPDDFPQFIQRYSLSNVSEEFPQLTPYNTATSTGRKLFSTFVASNTALTAHRELFARYLVTKSDLYVSPTDPHDLAYDHLEPVVNAYYQKDLDELGLKPDEPQLTELYPFFRSHLSKNGINRASGFQARYSFCRSMWIAMLVFGVSLAGLYITYVYQQSASEFTVTLSQNIPFETLAGYLTIAALILTSAVLIEFLFRLTMDTIPPILTWIGGTSVGLLLYTVLINVGLSRYPQIVVERLILEVAHVVYTMLSLVGEFYSWTLQYNGNEPVAVSTFGDSLLAVILFLTISMIAFFVATGSYKTNYVEYLVTDTWESLRENLNDESSSEEPDPERGS